MRYQHKPTVIDAEPFYPAKLPWPEGVFIVGNKFVVRNFKELVVVHHGDFIITGTKGEKYTCRADVFKESYEKVPDEPNTPGLPVITLPGV